jgi:hypothetical protein
MTWGVAVGTGAGARAVRGAKVAPCACRLRCLSGYQRSSNTPHPWVIENSPPPRQRRMRNVDGKRARAGSIGPEVTLPKKVPMVGQERWEQLRRLWEQDRLPVAEPAYAAKGK